MASLLASIDSPADLKKLPIHELPALCAELRAYITECCSKNPGHLGASLGAVELAVALHYVYNTPTDHLVWDVGHQAYAHKILTGRRDAFVTNRCLNGLSGFPKRSESPYDAFGTGHSSTSISAALGMAISASLKGTSEKSIAVIGDGSLTGGMAYEGLNNAGGSKADILIILNDNQMSISPNVGGLHNYLLKITTSPRYNDLKERTWSFLGSSMLRNFVQRSVKALKRIFVSHSTFFQPLGIRYFGPTDGHDVIHLVHTLRRLKNIDGPKLLHVLTVKGKGYAPAEKEQSIWHAPGLFDPDTGIRLSKTDPTQPQKVKFQQVFGETLLELAQANPKIVGVTPAMLGGCSMDIMKKALPDRCFDVGIAEQHAVTFSAGMAANGFLPYCNVYSSFIQRAYDSVIHDIALQDLKVILCMDRGGLVGEDGATHHGAFDLAFFHCVPNLCIAAPMDEVELRNMLYSVQDASYRATTLRYPRGTGAGITDWKQPFTFIPKGKSRLLHTGDSVALLSLGAAGLYGEKAVRLLETEGKQVYHVDMRFLKPLDEEVLLYAATHFNHIITLEDGCLIGGLHDAVASYITSHGYNVTVTGLGIPDHFIEQGTLPQLYHLCGYDVEGIAATIRSCC